MKKVFAFILFILCSLMIITVINAAQRGTPLAGSIWRFKTVVSDNPTTVHYLSTLYGKAEYNFSPDHTYNGKFFELPISGTWDSYADMLVLDQGTEREEVYKFTLTQGNHMILQATEKGNKVLIEFEKQ